MTIIRKDIRVVTAGDHFKHCDRIRVVIRVREITMQGVPSREIMHQRPHAPGDLQYLHAPHGSQVAVVIP